MTNLPPGKTPKEVIRYFQRKGFKKSFSWQDVYGEEHNQAFTVAKMTNLDLLIEVKGALEKSIEKGIPFAQFQKELTPMLKKKGWYGKTKVTDPKTGEEVEINVNSQRLKTIYHTNVMQSYNAGQWESIQETKETRPYLRYVHKNGPNPRKQHAAWNGLVLPVDDPFWQSHYPQNGYGCQCDVIQLSKRDLERFKYKVNQSPRIKKELFINKRTGERKMVPVGVQPGFEQLPQRKNKIPANLEAQKVMLSGKELGQEYIKNRLQTSKSIPPVIGLKMDSNKPRPIMLKQGLSLPGITAKMLIKLQANFAKAQVINGEMQVGNLVFIVLEMGDTYEIQGIKENEK